MNNRTLKPLASFVSTAVGALALCGCASSNSQTMSLGAKPADTEVAVDQSVVVGATEGSMNGSTPLTPVARPSPGPMPTEPNEQSKSGGPGITTNTNPPTPLPASLEVFDAPRLRAMKGYLVETDTAVGVAVVDSPDRFWTDLLAQMTDESMSEVLANSAAGAAERTEGVLLVRPTVLGVKNSPAAATSMSSPSVIQPNFDRASCRIELVEASTGRVLAIFSDGSTPARVRSALNDAHASSTADELGRACVRSWAEQLAERFDGERSR